MDSVKNDHQSQEKNKRIAEEMTKMVVRQTSLTYEEAKERLKASNGDYMAVIQQEHGINTCKEQVIQSKNQERYRQIRKYMDAGSENFRRQREFQELQEKQQMLKTKNK
tara:strand:+ start:186 stop:512 length:327 start_codon:yes stop_codon:yes gene_type:complete